MVEPLPNDIIECILDYLDKATLKRCALIQKAWAAPSQRRIFKEIELEANYPSLERLIAIFNEKPHLASSVRYLALDLNLIALMVPIQVSIAEVIQRLSNVNKIQFRNVNWHTSSPLLRTAMSDVLKLPYLTRVTISWLIVPKFADMASLLSHATHLEALEVRFLYFDEGTLPNPSALAANLPRSIKLNEFVTDDIGTFTWWFQQESCPFEVRNLRHLCMDGISTTRAYRSAGFMVQHVGGSLTKLELQLQSGTGGTYLSCYFCSNS